MPGLSCVSLRHVLSLLKASSPGNHWPQQPASKTQPTSVLGGSSSLHCWAPKSKAKDAHASGPGTQGLSGLGALHTWPSCGLPETVIQAFLSSTGAFTSARGFPTDHPPPVQTSENQGGGQIKGQPGMSTLPLRIRAEVLTMK